MCLCVSLGRPDPCVRVFMSYTSEGPPYGHEVDTDMVVPTSESEERVGTVGRSFGRASPSQFTDPWVGSVADDLVPSVGGPVPCLPRRSCSDGRRRKQLPETVYEPTVHYGAGPPRPRSDGRFAGRLAGRPAARPLGEAPCERPQGLGPRVCLCHSSPEGSTFHSPKLAKVVKGVESGVGNRTNGQRVTWNRSVGG